jgi:hypothetical protein
MQWRIYYKLCALFVGLGLRLMRYPLTWLVLVLVALTHGSFSWWFQPAAAMQWLALGIDAGAVLLWGGLAGRSAAFQAWHTHLLYDTTMRQAQDLLAACPEAFALPAHQCLALLQQIGQEFTEAASQQELATLIRNVAQLAQAHHTLHLRAQRFGTPEQKSAMTAMLQRHIVSITDTLTTLQAFSGNLTLLSANVAADQGALQELHFLNEGLQAVLQEFHHVYP